MFLAESLDKLDVLLLFTVGGQNAQMSLTFVKGLGGLSDATG